MPFESGIPAYVKAQATVTVFFPIDERGNRHIRCELCPYYSSSTRKCWLTGEVIAFPMKYVGSECPLEEVTEKEGEENGAEIPSIES